MTVMSTPREISLTPASDGVEILFHKHNQRVFRTAYRVTGSAADAEDVLQTVFLRITREQETAAAAENGEAYFARAAINASLDLLRSRKRSRSIAIDDLENEASVAPGISKQNPETHHEDKELRNLIREAVAKLGDTAGQMFALRYFEGYGNGEIADMAFEYFDADSDKENHKTICKGGKKGTVKGTVSEKDGMKIVKVSKDGVTFDK